MSAKKCQICNKPSGMYPLCQEHLKLKSEGKVIKNIETGKWEFNEKDVIIKNAIKSSFLTNKKYDNCVICSKDSKNKPLCLECYKSCHDLEDEVDRNKKPFELKDYYFNLKSANYRVVSKEVLIRNCKMMYALANVIIDSYDDSSLVSRINDDVYECVCAFNNKKEIKETSYTNQSDSQKSGIIRTLDGHIVKSKGEGVIDDILYNNLIPHCYEKDVIEISSKERNLKADWFIPVAGNKGIYIEYWGMTTITYLKNKDEKRKIYKDNNIHLIEVEKDDVNDVNGLNARIVREIKELKEIIKKSI